MKKKYSNIIVTGCDKTGKSTLIKGLTTALADSDYKYHKGDLPKSTEEAINTAHAIIYRCDSHNKSFLMDRFNYPDELVYSHVMAGTPSSELIDQFSEIFDWLVETKPLFIYCEATEYDIARRFIAEKEEVVGIDQIKDILGQYRKYMAILRAAGVPVLQLNSSHMTATSMLAIALDQIETGGQPIYDYQIR